MTKTQTERNTMRKFSAKIIQQNGMARFVDVKAATYEEAYKLAVEQCSADEVCAGVMEV